MKRNLLMMAVCATATVALANWNGNRGYYGGNVGRHDDNSTRSPSLKDVVVNNADDVLKRVFKKKPAAARAAAKDTAVAGGAIRVATKSSKSGAKGIGKVFAWIGGIFAFLFGSSALAKKK